MFVNLFHFIHTLSYFKGSWQKRIIERVYNVEKCNVKKKKTAGGDKEGFEPQKKKSKVISFYPPLDHSQATDSESYQRHYSALKSEMIKSKPRMEVVLQLMADMYIQRRDFVLNDAGSAIQVLTEYAAFKFPEVVSKL